jgi:PAS domain S-box-containing protein
MTPTAASRIQRAAGQFLIGLAALALLTLVCSQLGLDSTPTAFLYLIIIVLLSLRGTFVPLAALSVVAVTCLNYFFVPPVFRLRIDNPVDALELSAFLITALVITRAVSRSRRAEERSAERAQLLDLTHDTIFVQDMGSVIKYWNRGAEERYGWTAEQAVGRVAHDLLKTAFPLPLEQIKAEVMRTGRWEGELVHTRRDGTQIVVASRWALQRDERGEPVAVLEINNDISERRRAEEKIRQQEMELRRVLDFMPHLVGVFGSDRGRLYANQPAFDYFGVTLEQWQGISDPLWFFHPDDRERVARDVYTAPGSDVPHEFEARLRRKDGVYRWFLLRDNPLREEQGRIVRWYLSATDIEDRKRAEEALRRSEASLAEAQRLTHTGSWALDVASGKFVYASEECIRMYEHDAQEGLPTREATFRLIHPEDQDSVQAGFEKSLREKVDTSSEFRLVLPSGTVKHVQTIRHPVLNEAGDVVQVVGTTIDITERKRAEDALRRSEADLNRAQEIARVGSWQLDIARNQLTWSNEVYRMFDMPRDTALGYRAFLGMVHPEDRERVDRAWAAALQGAPYDIEHRILVGDQLKWVRERAEVEFDPQGKAVRGIGTVQDITERKRAEEALRRSEAYLAEAQRLSHTGSWAMNTTTGEYEYWSEELYRMYGYDPQEGLPSPRTILQQRVQEDPGGAEATLLEAIREKTDTEYEYKIVLPDGTIKHIHTIRHPVLNDAGDVVELVGTAMDITERKRAEEALRESEERLRLAVSAAKLGVFEWDVPSEITRWENERMFEISGRTHAEGPLSHQAFYAEVLEPEDRPAFDQAFTAAMRTGHPFNLICRARRCNDGQQVWIEYSGRFDLAPDGSPKRLVGVIEDITEAKQAEDRLRHTTEALRRSEAYLAEAERLSHTGTWAFDLASNKYVYFSEEGFRIFELDTQEGPPPREAISRLIHPEDWDRVNGDFEKSVREKADISSEFRITLPSGTAKHVQAIRHPVLNDAGEVVQLVGSVMDITERKHAEQERERLRQLEADLAHINRVSMMGELAGSIAHEVNQPLTAIVNNANACLGLLPGGGPGLDEVREALADIVSDAERGSAIIGRVRGMAKRSEPERVPLQLADVVKDVVALAAKEAAARHASIHQDVPADLPVVLGDRVQLQQVLLNLVVNAIDAMSNVEEAQRRIEIVGRPDMHEDRPAVVIRVRDRGIGFKGGEAERLFEAFYTTKSHGMGLGLAISRSVIKAHGGRMWAEPNQGPGATLCFSLPAAVSPS